jgi:hypothetical protein
MMATPMEWADLHKSAILLFSLTLLLSAAAIHQSFTLAAFSPHQSDSFKYSETTDLGNGTGNYAGYTEHQDVTGAENVVSVNGNTVSMNYSYTYRWSNSSGSIRAGTNSGPYTFSSSSFRYLNGTDNETSFGGAAYVHPSVWFAMNNSLPVGANFTILNTSMKIVSTNSAVMLPTENVIVGAIFAQGSGSYQRNDVYGQFNSSYTWSAWYDSKTGYIVGYNYVEHDTNPSGDGFDYTDKLYVTSTSYLLSTVSTLTEASTSAANLNSSSSGISVSSSSTSTVTIPVVDLDVIGVIIVVLIVLVAVLAISRRRRMTEVKDMDTQTHV